MLQVATLKLGWGWNTWKDLAAWARLARGPAVERRADLGDEHIGGSRLQRHRLRRWVSKVVGLVTAGLRRRSAGGGIAYDRYKCSSCCCLSNWSCRIGNELCELCFVLFFHVYKKAKISSEEKKIKKWKKKTNNETVCTCNATSKLFPLESSCPSPFFYFFIFYFLLVILVQRFEQKEPVSRASPRVRISVLALNSRNVPLQSPTSSTWEKPKIILLLFLAYLYECH